MQDLQNTQSRTIEEMAESVSDVAEMGHKSDNGLTGELDSLTKAVIIYDILPKDILVVVTKSLDPDKLFTILEAKKQKTIEDITEEEIEQVVDGFIFLMGEVRLALMRGEYLPHEEENGEVEKEEEKPKPKPKPPKEKKDWFSFLDYIDQEWLLELLVGENSQVLAVVLSYADKERAAYVLSRLTIDRKAEVIKRMAKLGNIVPTMMDRLEGVLRDRLREFVYGVVVGKRPGTLDQVAAIMNRLEEGDVRWIIDKIGTTDPDLSQVIENKLLTFEDLKLLDNKDMQKLIRSVDLNQLTLALKGASDDMKNKILSNISSRGRAIIEEDLEIMGPRRLSQIEKAQRSVVATAKDLASAEEYPINLPITGGGDLIVE